MDVDDVDFTVSGNSRSRLSSLFQNESSSGDVNEALTFTAPKQPKKTDNAQSALGTLKLLHAVIVHAYKLKDGSYTNQGKLGCAVLGHHETYTYKLLLYKGKQIQVTIVSITSNFVFHVQSNNYANFYDQKKENWSINFDSEAALFDFTKQVALAKANSQNPASLVIQDLVKGEGQSLENGDTAEVKYSGWLLQNCTFGQMFDSNMNSESSFRVRLGKGKVIKGWNDGLLGMQKGGKRLLVIPSELAYGAEGMGNTIPPHSSLIFEVHVVKIKVGRETSHSPSPVKIADSTSDKKPDVPPRQSISQEDNIKMRGASISEQLSQVNSPKKDKAQLISRMAKMGTATLPFQGAVAAHVSSDSESETELPQPSSPALQNISRTSSPKAFSKPRSQTNSEPLVSSQIVQPQPVQASMPYHVSQHQPSSQMSLYAQSVMPSQQPFVCASTPFSAYQQQIPGQFSMPPSPYSAPSIPGYNMPPVSTSMVDSHFSLLMSETRNQNSEVRISLSKITDKVDTVLHKVDELNLQRRATSTSMPLMESAVILQNIERIIQENKILKEDNEAKVSKIQSLNEIICDLFQRNPRLPEESTNMLGQKNELLQAAADQSQEQISNLEHEKSKLQLELSSVSSKLNKLESDVAKYQKIESDLNEKLEEVQKESKAQIDLANAAQEKMNENRTLIKSLQEKLQAAEHEKELLNMKLQSVEEEHSKAEGSSDLIDIYKREIQEYKEKIEHLNSEISNSVSAAQHEEVKQNMGRELAEVNSSKEKLASEIKEMKKKIESLEEQKLSYEDKIRRLESEVENAQLLKRKFEVFQEKTRALKETYENQIVELMNEIKNLKSTTSSTSPEFSVEIKRVMNRLYKLLQGKFESSSSYTGSEVLQTVLQNIMAITFQILESKNQPSADQANINESTQKDLSKKEVTTDESQKEFPQQNGLSELKVVPVSNDPVADVVLSDVESSKKDSNVVLEEPKDGVQPETFLVPEMNEESDSVVNKEDGAKPADELNVKVDESVINKNDDVESMAKLKVEGNESVKRESPENNAPMPSSNLFSELLSGTDGTKIWRQPPPLFDDDEDEEEDDDWLK